MLKQIPTTQLKKGMFLHDLDLQLSFFPAIKTQTSISNTLLKSIIETGIENVIIDTQKGCDVEEPRLTTKKHKITITHSRKNRQAIPPSGLPEIPATSLTEELAIAKTLKRQSQVAINNAFDNVNMGLKLNTKEIKQSVIELTDSIIRNQDALLSLANIRKKSNFMYDHAINCCVLTLAFAKWQQLDYDSVINLGMAALLHDIGETKLDDKLINLKGNFDDKQHEEIKQHVQYSVELLSSSIGIHPQVVKLVQQHHERNDGSGYPNGLKGTEIDPLAQIIGLIDLYDSMTAETLYNLAIAPTQVLKQLLESENELFDAILVKQFIKCIGIYPVGSLVKLSNGCIAIVNEIQNHDSLHPVVRMIYNARQEHFIQPVDLNLSDSIKSGKTISIKSSIDPNHLHIDLASFI